MFFTSIFSCPIPLPVSLISHYGLLLLNFPCLCLDLRYGLGLWFLDSSQKSISPTCALTRRYTHYSRHSNWAILTSILYCRGKQTRTIQASQSPWSRCSHLILELSFRKWSGFPQWSVKHGHEFLFYIVTLLKITTYYYQRFYFCYWDCTIISMFHWSLELNGFKSKTSITPVQVYK